MSKSISPPKFLCILRNMSSYSTYICRIYKQHSKSIVLFHARRALNLLRTWMAKNYSTNLLTLM